MILYVVRHGEAVWNTQNKICGRTDSPLTDKGRAQAAALAPKMPKVDRVLCSPLSRARETAVLMVTAPYTEPEPWTRMGVTELSSSSSREKLSTRLSLLTVMVL